MLVNRANTIKAVKTSLWMPRESFDCDIWVRSRLCRLNLHRRKPRYLSRYAHAVQMSISFALCCAALHCVKLRLLRINRKETAAAWSWIWKDKDESMSRRWCAAKRILSGMWSAFAVFTGVGRITSNIWAFRQYLNRKDRGRLLSFFVAPGCMET